MIIKIFWKENCPKCPDAKKVGEALLKGGYDVTYYDVESLDGLTEATLHSVMSTPSIIVSNNGKEVKSWRSDPPKFEEVKEWMDQFKN